MEVMDLARKTKKNNRKQRALEEKLFNDLSVSPVTEILKNTFKSLQKKEDIKLDCLAEVVEQASEIFASEPSLFLVVSLTNLVKTFWKLQQRK
jgi:hypothetical protein